MINKSDSRCAVVRFCYHSYDYRLNWTPLSPITITKHPCLCFKHCFKHVPRCDVFILCILRFFHDLVGSHLRTGRVTGDVAALVRSHMNGLQPFERTIEQTTETMLPNHKTIIAAAMTTNRITSLRELLHYCV